ncbi:sulfite exporter TauE/SafE family protein [Streptomyces sp. NPDC057386]|jgi:uncharacterized membrane protein YfcA|uniref:Probable membrane transporter protein n=2 Tax=Streptomyces TaxID=1883 RepID=A0ABV5V798_9ACTN
MTILALLAGAVIGLTLGTLGGGGSVLTVPALIYLLGFTPVAATTASLVVVTVTSAVALTAHARAGHVGWRTGLLFAAAGIVPALLGGALAARLPDAVLTAAFALVAAPAAARMLRPRKSTLDARRTERTEPTERTDRTHRTPTPPAAPGTPRTVTRVRPAQAAAAGAGLGGLTGVLGVGGGFLVVPALTGVLGMRMRAAVGTSLLVITVNAPAALALRSGTIGTLDWSVTGPFIGAAVLGAWDGRRLAAKVSADALRRVFAVLLLAVAAFMLLDAAL